MRLLDAHLHLQDPCFDGDRTAVLARSAAVGVEFLICNGTSEADWPQVEALRGGAVVPCFGLHPRHMAARSRNWLDRLRALLEQHRAGVGEIGLDRVKADVGEDEQEEAFRAQLALARELKRPAMVHCVQAWEWLHRILQSEPPLERGLLIHAYSGSAAMIPRLAAFGCWFSFGGRLLDPRRERLHEALRAAPRERLLLETDSPDLPPPPEFCLGEGRPGRNEPANLPAIAAGAARLLAMDPEELAADVWRNAWSFFGELLDDR